MVQTGFQNRSKMGPEITPTWAPNGSKIAPQRPLGGLLGPCPRQIFERFLDPFGVPFGVPESLQHVLKFKLKSGSLLMLNVVALGASWGPCWANVGVLFGVPMREAGFLKNH